MKILPLFLLLLLIPSNLTANNDYFDFEYNGIYYKITSNNTCSVSCKEYYNGLGGVESPDYKGIINIPVEVFHNEQKYSVTSIESEAFNHRPVTEVTLPNTIKVIEFATFAQCYSLRRISLPDSLERIETGAFVNCESLDSIYFPNTLRKIGWSSFHGCYSLSTLIIPSSVDSILYDAFGRCRNIKSIIFENSGKELYIDASEVDTGDIIYTTKKLGGQFSACTLDSVYIGRNIISFHESDESNRDFFPPFGKVSVVTLGDNCTEIGKRFFAGSAIKKIELSNNLFSIGDYAFSGCSKLTSIAIPNSIISLGDGVFAGCTSLTSVEIPSSVECIGDYAFSGCSKLTSAGIPNSITTIGKYAFEGCLQLKTIRLPRLLMKIDDSAFNGCKSLNKIECWAINPPSLGSTVFENIPTKAIIHVLKNSKDKYAHIWKWKNDYIIDDLTIRIDMDNYHCEINDCDTAKAYCDSEYLSVVVWSSSDSTILVIDPNTGVFTGKSSGIVTITATLIDDMNIFGTAQVFVGKGGTDFSPQGIELIDLGLPSGTLWANMNIGASHVEDLGGKFAWGETEEKDSYSWNNYKFHYSDDYWMTKYSVNWNADFKTTLEEIDDAAFVNWGSCWAIPSIDQMNELVSSCHWEQTAVNGVEGYKVVGSNGNELFFPMQVDGITNYWTNGVGITRAGYAWSLALSFSHSETVEFDTYRYLGSFIRPVSRIPFDFGPGSKSETDTSVETINTNTEVKAIFNLDGTRFNSLRPGLNIIYDSIGESKKIIIRQ